MQQDAVSIPVGDEVSSDLRISSVFLTPQKEFQSPLGMRFLRIAPLYSPPEYEVMGFNPRWG